MKQNIKIQNVSILGNGMLGTQIAMVARFYGYEVYLFDPVPDMFAKTINKYRNEFQSKGTTPSIPIDQWDAIKNQCHICRSVEEALEKADLVIEALPELIEMKKEIFEIMGKTAPAHTILATNSSSIPVSRMEESSGHPERCLNLHFYQILSGMNAVDVMGGTSTLPSVKEKAVSWVRSIGCLPLFVKKELLGFCFNRVWRAVKRETLYMWANDFVDYQDVDKAWMIFTGMNMGPFGIMDLVGLDTTYNIEMVYFQESNDPKDHPPEALKKKIEKGELGVKSGKGFYSYPKPKYDDKDFLKP